MGKPGLRWPLALLVVAVALSACARPSGASASATETAVRSGESAIPTADQSAWPDGLPRVLAGLDVHRGEAIAQKASTATGDSPFLIGGYLVNSEALCEPSSLPPNPLVSDCPSGWFLVDSPSYPPTLVAENGSYRLNLTAGTQSNPGFTWTFVAPVVLRVHVHDAQARSCPSQIAQSCEQAIVVEAGLWQGNANIGPVASPSR
jgi:hypothetical protein